MSQAVTNAYTTINTLRVDTKFKHFVDTELLADLGIAEEEFWRGLERIVEELQPENQRLLEKREELQHLIDDWHRGQTGSVWDAAAYQLYLKKIGYLVDQGPDFHIETENVDPEIASIAGPQLVVPVSNARFALNAANARWGSLYDALYGSDVIDELHGQERRGAYNPVRGNAVIAYASQFLDEAVPLSKGSHADVKMYKLSHHDDITALEVLFEDGSEIPLLNPEQFVGHHGEDGRLVLLVRNNGLHLEIVIDSTHPIGKHAEAHVADVMVESAITTIQDCEDSVAAVDADDKIGVYRNWLGLMRGTLVSRFNKGSAVVERALNEDRHYTDYKGQALQLPGRSLLLVRNVGHLMTNAAVMDRHGNEIPEGILDAVITSTCALHDLRQSNSRRNSQIGSMYIVKPKMHGPDEAAFTDTLFSRVEDMLGLRRYTLKIGVMDEERRTTVNLQACIRAVKNRLVFINTGFLDRTGDEIHTSMQAGVMLPKDHIKSQPWIDAYERWNVDVGIRCGLPGRAQIGKGMWAKPDELAEMVATKHGHLRAGANCAWVPSPTAATLHAMHYHQLNVFDIQNDLAQRDHASLEDILTPPIALSKVSETDIENELRNSCQSILGYVVRWIDEGVGCSKVPDINDVGLMEDRATLRISSQLLANWLEHKLVSADRVRDTLEEMALVVDRQNGTDPNYRPMAPDFNNNIAFLAAQDLILLGAVQPNGYTEPLLHRRRLQKKLMTN